MDGAKLQGEILERGAESERKKPKNISRNGAKVIARTIHFLSEPGAEWSLNLEGAEKLGQCAMEGGRVEENR